VPVHSGSVPARPRRLRASAFSASPTRVPCGRHRAGPGCSGRSWSGPRRMSGRPYPQLPGPLHAPQAGTTPPPRPRHYPTRLETAGVGPDSMPISRPRWVPFSMPISRPLLWGRETRPDDRLDSYRQGMHEMRTVLRAGERIRTPQHSLETRLMCLT
jgi:hypothetical protein